MRNPNPANLDYSGFAAPAEVACVDLPLPAPLLGCLMWRFLPALLAFVTVLVGIGPAARTNCFESSAATRRVIIRRCGVLART